jgi:FkbM family methyltransferase
MPKTLIKNYEFVRKYSSKLVINKKNKFFVIKHSINHFNLEFYLKINSSDPLVFEQIVLLEEYKCIINLFKELTIRPKNMIDAGANIGLTSIYFKAFYPELNIIALEPNSSVGERLSLNITKNKLKQIKLYNKGLWSKTTSLSIDNSFRDGEDWSYSVLEDLNGNIKAVDLKSLIDSENLDIIDFIKIDIEGSEKEVFERGDLSWLKRTKVIAIEIHDEFDCRNHIEETLIQFGFELSHSGELTIGVNQNLN